MFNKSILFIAILFSCLTIGCSNTNSKPLAINFSKDSAQIEITNINEAGLFQLKNNLKTDSSYQKLVSVLQTPADDDSTSMEMEWQGKLDLKGDTLLFIPKKPFEKNKLYLVETMINVQFAKSSEIVKSDVGHQVKPQQKYLTR